MPRTANKSSASTPRAMPHDQQIGGHHSSDPNDTVLNALNADRAAPDPGAKDQGSERQADTIERGSPEKPARSRPTH